MQKTGSAKRGIVSSDLLEERAKVAFDQGELRVLLQGGEEINRKWCQTVDLVGNDPVLRNSLEFNDMTVTEM